MDKIFITILTLLLFMSCGNKTKNRDGQRTYEIKKPDIPVVMTSERDRRNYMAAHFWDEFDFADTSFLREPQVNVLGQAFADYLGTLGYVSEEKRTASVRGLLKHAEAAPEMFDKFTALFEHYLYDPNSPARDEELYITVLEYIVASDKIDEYEKLRPQSQLATAMKNRVGHKAADVTIRTAGGSQISLYDIKADYVVLYINNPDCNACAEVTAGLTKSRILSPLFGSGTLKVFAVYPDEDIDAWRNHLPSMPADWVNGYDESLVMRDEETYDLRAIPSVYLLDKDKTVLVKDAASVEQLEAYFVRSGIIRFDGHR